MGFRLSKIALKEIHHQMVSSRLLDERLIQIFKKRRGYFWVGAPGEEAFGVPLGRLVKKGQGLEYDWLHLHYRCTGTVIAMGLQTKDALRQMMSRKTDPFTKGKNFIHHYVVPEWNIPPVSSVVEIQHSIAIGTAYAQKENHKGITIVTGGDAGTALADFATSLVWASRPCNPLPLLIIVINNRFGISTSFDGQHSEKYITDRGKAFGIKTYNVNGNNIEESYCTLQESIEYVRKNRKPALLEAEVSRLYGHSSSSGANYDESQICPLKTFEQKLIQEKILSQKEIEQVHQKIFEKLKQEELEVSREQEPDEPPWAYIYAENEESNWRNF